MKVLSLLVVAFAFLFTAASAEATVAKSAVITKTTDGTIVITPVISGEPTEVERPDPEEGGPSIDPVPNPEDPKPDPDPIKPEKPCDPKEPGDCPVTNPVLPGNPVGFDPVPNPEEGGPSIDPVPNPEDPKPDPDPIKPEKPCDPKEPGDCPVTNPVLPGNPVGFDPVPNPEEGGPSIDPVPNPEDPKPDPDPDKPGKLPCDPKVIGDCPVGINPPVGTDPVPNPEEDPVIVPGDPGDGTPVTPGDPGQPGEEPGEGNPGTPLTPGDDVDCSKCPVVNPGGYFFEPKPDDEAGIH